MNGEGNGTLLQYFCLENPMDGGAGRLQTMGSIESDTTERLHFHFSLSCIGEGNGNPLQCSCLENPGDGGAWWAAISGVAQSWTWLKWLSSSSYLLLDGKNKSFVNFIMLLTQQWNLQIHSFTPIFWIWSVTTELLNCSEILGINKGLCWQQKLQAWYFLCW